MNVVTASRSAAPPAVAAPRVDLKALLDQHLAPARQLKAWQPIAERIEHLHPLPLVIADNTLARARTRIERLPSDKVLLDAEAMFRRALTTAAEEPIARLLVGVMLDGLRSRTNDTTAGYIDALMFVLQDDEAGEFDFNAAPYSAEVLAWAVRRVLRQNIFPPAPTEMVKICRDVKGQMRKGLALADHMLELRYNAEDLLLKAGEAHLLDLGEEWPELGEEWDV
jgi:hypothetical protein